jgi:hypothetical protein
MYIIQDGIDFSCYIINRACRDAAIEGFRRIRRGGHQSACYKVSERLPTVNGYVELQRLIAVETTAHLSDMEAPIDCIG